MPDNLLTSAEMTAYWRSQYPELSGDRLSALLVSEEGIKLANDFKQNVYPLIEHHLSLRNRFFYTRALLLLRSGHYDACVSIGSGLSLLNHYLAESVSNLKFCDTDLPEVLEMRNKRLERISGKFKATTLERICSRPLDLEGSFTNNLRLRDLLPDYSSPLFIVEGVVYYLSRDCFVWFFNQLSHFEDGSFIFDYWPEYAEKKSSTVRRMLDFLDVKVRERVKMFHSQKEIENLARPKRVKEDSEILDIEPEFVKQPLLTNIDEIVPSRHAVIV